MEGLGKGMNIFFLRLMFRSFLAYVSVRIHGLVSRRSRFHLNGKCSKKSSSIALRNCVLMLKTQRICKFFPNSKNMCQLTIFTSITVVSLMDGFTLMIKPMTVSRPKRRDHYSWLIESNITLLHPMTLLFNRLVSS